MQQGVLYTIFLLLTVGVGLALFLIYHSVKTPSDHQSALQKSSQYDDISHQVYETEVQQSWLREVREEQSRRTYFYAVTQIQIKLY